MKKLRVMILMHQDLVPPEDVHGLSDKEYENIKCECDVIDAVRSLGHEVYELGLSEELAPLRKAILRWKPHIAFNLLEEFRDQAVYDQNVVGYLELMRVPYTGNSPRGLLIARDKALTKKIVHFHRIATPGFFAIRVGRRPRRPGRFGYPVIVKSQIEDASAGIAQASVVNNDEALEERVRFVHESTQGPAIVEQFIDGRDLYASVLGNKRLTVLPIWEISLDKLPPGSHRIASYKAKFDLEYQKQHAIKIRAAKNLSDEMVRRIQRAAKRCYRVLSLSGYARIDFRLTKDGQLYLLEANPNPDISEDEELASAARAAGMSYKDVIQKVLNLGLRRNDTP
jgi:D-alanine-D-alanine ligase